MVPEPPEKQLLHCEIDAALASFDDSKAPGLDGDNVVFFKKTLHIIKEDIYIAV